MATPLAVGVIGLGRRWQKRYRPALEKLPELFEVRALCDEVHQRALNEAYRLGCAAMAGPTELIESDVEAILLLDPGWYRLWPLEAAARAGKPVFCCATPDLDEDHADAVCRRVRESRLPVALELALRSAPALLRLRELLVAHLGPARLIVAEAVQPSSASMLGLLDCCADLLAGEPTSVTAAGDPGGGLDTLCLTFPQGQALQLTRWHGQGARQGMRLRVAAEHGLATIELPDRVEWNDANGRYREVRRRRPHGARLLRQFHQALTTGRPPRPSLDEAERVRSWLEAARRSREEGRRVELTSQ